VGYSFIADINEISATTRPDGQPSFMLVTGKRRIMLFDGTVTVGRDDSCNIVFDHPSVSRLHAWLIVSGDTIVVKDNASKNGTRIDKVQVVESQHAHAGQQLSFGRLDTTIVGKDAMAGSTLTAPETSN
jgi:pSer/pThr/pTyr-binding forkhead associated (FHA) protein